MGHITEPWYGLVTFPFGFLPFFAMKSPAFTSRIFLNSLVLHSFSRFRFGCLWRAVVVVRISACNLHLLPTCGLGSGLSTRQAWSHERQERSTSSAPLLIYFSWGRDTCHLAVVYFFLSLSWRRSKRATPLTLYFILISETSQHLVLAPLDLHILRYSYLTWPVYSWYLSIPRCYPNSLSSLNKTALCPGKDNPAYPMFPDIPYRSPFNILDFLLTVILTKTCTRRANLSTYRLTCLVALDVLWGSRHIKTSMGDSVPYWLPYIYLNLELGPQLLL